MDKQERLKAKVLADTLRMMATKIENGFPVTEEQKGMLRSLAKEIVFLHPTKYNKPEWKIEEKERQTSSYESKKSEDIGKEPGE